MGGNKGTLNFEGYHSPFAFLRWLITKTPLKLSFWRSRCKMWGHFWGSRRLQDLVIFVFHFRFPSFFLSKYALQLHVMSMRDWFFEGHFFVFFRDLGSNFIVVIWIYDKFDGLFGLEVIFLCLISISSIYIPINNIILLFLFVFIKSFGSNLIVNIVMIPFQQKIMLRV